jgi:poly(3-hydroxybutyrate) depolymerase
VYVDSGGHAAFTMNAEAQARSREFVGSSGLSKGGTTTAVSTTHPLDGEALPVIVRVHVPEDAQGATDVVVLLHGTITSPMVRPEDAAEKFIALMRVEVRASDRVLVSVAYPQDAIPLANQSSFGDVGGLLFGDNIRYPQAAIGWVHEELAGWLASNAPGITPGRLFLFGHSQGAYLAHRLNALVDSDGVIANATGPIDLLDRCALDEKGPNDNVTCNKLEMVHGPTATHPGVYEERSLKVFLTGHRAPSLFVQATDDTKYQVDLMRAFEVSFRAANP